MISMKCDQRPWLRLFRPRKEINPLARNTPCSWKFHVSFWSVDLAHTFQRCRRPRLQFSLRPIVQRRPFLWNRPVARFCKPNRCHAMPPSLPLHHALRNHWIGLKQVLYIYFAVYRNIRLDWSPLPRPMQFSADDTSNVDLYARIALIYST